MTSIKTLSKVNEIKVPKQLIFHRKSEAKPIKNRGKNGKNEKKRKKNGDAKNNGKLTGPKILQNHVNPTSSENVYRKSITLNEALSKVNELTGQGRKNLHLSEGF